MTKSAFSVLLVGSLASVVPAASETALPLPSTQSQQAGVQQTASIAGIVVKLGSNEAVPEAGVELRRAGSGPAKAYTVRATSVGKFAFKDIPPGEYRLAAARAGFVRSEYGQRGPNGRGLPITLSAGQDMKDVRIALAQTGTISGHIYDRKGAPIANVQVLALKYVYRGSSRALLAVKAATTNDLGEYRLFGLPPAQYAISAMPLRGAIRDMVTEIMSDGY